MEKQRIKIIHKYLQEYMGTGASGGNSTDGNSIKSPRPYPDDKTEIQKAYTDKNVYGAEGGHYRKDFDRINYNAPAAQSSGGPRYYCGTLASNGNKV